MDVKAFVVSSFFLLDLWPRFFWWNLSFLMEQLRSKNQQNMYRKLILALLDPLQSLIFILRLERWLAKQHRKTDDSDGPEIHFIRMTERTWHDLRCQVVESPTNTDFLLISELKFGGFAEITDFDLLIFVEKDVGEFQITMNDLILMHVLNSLNDLNDIFSSVL